MKEPEKMSKRDTLRPISGGVAEVERRGEPTDVTIQKNRTESVTGSKNIPEGKMIFRSEVLSVGGNKVIKVTLPENVHLHGKKEYDFILDPLVAEGKIGNDDPSGWNVRVNAENPWPAIDLAIKIALSGEGVDFKIER